MSRDNVVSPGWSRAVVEVPALQARTRRPRVARGWHLDRIAGLLDGWRGLPDDSGADTARLRRIQNWSVETGCRVAGFYTPLFEDVSSTRDQFEVHVQLEQRRLAAAQADLEHLRLRGPMEGMRHGEAGLADDLVCTRRHSEFEALLADCVQRCVACEQALGFARAGVSAAEHQLARLREQMRCDIQVVSAVAGKRAAAYLAGVTATHPDRSALLAVVASTSEIDHHGPHEPIHLVATEETA